MEDADERRRRAFGILQPVCSVLLQSRQDAAALSQLLAGKLL